MKYSRKKLKELINEYAKSENVKSFAGLSLFLAIDKETLKKWEFDSESKYYDLINYAKTLIEKDIIENGLRGKYNATMASFLLKATFGYSDKGQIQNDSTVKIEVADELLKYSN